MQGRSRLVEFAVSRPRLVIIITAIVTLGFMTQFLRMKTDTDPKNMLPPTSEVRVWNDSVDKTFSLHADMLVLGVVSESGVMNPSTLSKIARMTDEILLVPGVVARDVNSLTTVTNVTAKDGALNVAPLVPKTPETQDEAKRLKDEILSNPLMVDRMISEDGRVSAIYIPIENGANGKKVADAISEIAQRQGGPEIYHVAGDPVARDTFGSEMFKLMGILSPVAAVIMFVAVYLMFRSLLLAFSMLAVAMTSVIWSMGLFIGLGFPIHIMSSMAPVFLMAIATDSIHIFNEYYFRRAQHANADKKSVIIETMAAVARPVKYTALATTAGFGVLMLMDVVPVKVFGALVAFGTIVLRVLSFSLVPAILTFLKDGPVIKRPETEDQAGTLDRFLGALGSFGSRAPGIALAAGAVVFVVAIVGLTRINVNNNMVEWFKAGSEVRVADSALNKELGGTSTGRIVAMADSGFIKEPEAMRAMEALQRRIERLPEVGKTSSVVDIVKRINLVLHDNDPAYDSVPDTGETIGQYLFLFGMSAKQSDLDNVVDYDYNRANILVQLKTWDASAMRKVMAEVEAFGAENPGLKLAFKPAGTAYFNLVWNDTVLWDMLKGFVIALGVIFVILAVDFRSVKWALIGYLPLVFTVLIIYGAVGYMGKDFDMPIAVLSSLSLGMAVDFAIHFITRFKQRIAEEVGNVRPGPEAIRQALMWSATRPGKGIMRNALLFASAFSVMLLAPLTPYVTVGAFIVGMMSLSSILSIIYLPALITIFYGRLFKDKEARQ